jgi:hypothetical protein
MKDPKKTLTILLTTLTASMLLPGCATIVGGSKYYAHVTVDGHPNATIYYKGYSEGKGYAAFRVPRREANAFAVTIKEENCENQNFLYKERSFRGWAFFGTLVGWTGVSPDGVPLPWGMIVDLLDGSLWKPSLVEKGVTKTDYKHYNYLIDYDKCERTGPTQNIQVKSKAERLKELKELLDNGTLTQEEFDKEKKKILDNK